MNAAASLLAALIVALSWLNAAPAPAEDSEAGRRAWQLLGGFYQAKDGDDGGLGAAIEASLKDLAGTDEAKSRMAADLLQALIRQSSEDESNGRAVWKRTPFWGGGSESSAREFRKHLAKKLGATKPVDAAVPLATWLLQNERLPDGLQAAVHLLRGNSSEAANGVLLVILGNGTHWRPALEMALTEAAERGLQVPLEVLIRWAGDARESVRTAASAALKKLQLPEPPPFVPEMAFTPELEKRLRDVLSLLPDPPAPDATFGTLTVVRDYGRAEKHTSKSIGWLVREENDAVHFVSWFGENEETKKGGNWKTEVVFQAGDVAEAVAGIRQTREEKDEDGRSTAHEKLSVRGGLTGQFQPQSISMPEGLLAAWLFHKGERALTAQLIFPLLDAMNDDRWAFEILRDLQGGQCHLAMLEAFSYGRDYAKSLRLARHLSQPLFDGYNYQERAKELAVQLPKRMEDFKTFTLPAPDDWKKIAEDLPRAKQVEYLTTRLRLLNCFQSGQPGDVDYRDTQYRMTGPQWGEEEEVKDAVVINPFNELFRMKLTPVDVEVLAPFLKDENYLPTFSYWRDFHPGRTLHRVNWLVAELVNAAAMRTLIDLNGWSSLDPAERDVRVENVTAWAKSMNGKTIEEVLQINMREASILEEWDRAASVAARSKEASLMVDLLAGAEKFPEHKGRIAELCFQHGDPSAVRSARLWMKVGEPSAKLYSALILLRHGSSEEKQNARNTLSTILGGEWDEELVFNGTEPMLSLNDEGVTAILCRVLRRNELDWNWTGAALAHRLFLTKHPDALTAIAEVLNSTEDVEEETGVWQTQQVKRQRTRGDRIAESLARMRKDYEFPGFAPDTERADARQAFIAWLKEQAALLTAGKPTPELMTEAPSIRASQWQIDAP
ncbi:MAG: hypothetical protein ACKV19_17730 [Verrucomicrobiales bacterium]